MEALSLAALVTVAVYVRRLWQRDWDILHLHGIDVSAPAPPIQFCETKLSIPEELRNSSRTSSSSGNNDECNNEESCPHNARSLEEIMHRASHIKSRCDSGSSSSGCGGGAHVDNGGIGSRHGSTASAEWRDDGGGSCGGLAVPPEQVNLIGQLPPELLLYIFSFLELEELCRVAGVSRQWRQLAQDGSLYSRVVAKKQITYEGVTRMLRYAGSFCELVDLSRLEGLSPTRLTSLMTFCQRTTSFTLKLSEEFLKIENPLRQLSSLRGLKRLSLEESNGLLDKHLSVLDSFPDLQFLSLKNCCRLTNLAFQSVTLSKLEFLDLSGCELITFRGFEQLSKLECPLRVTVLKDCKNLQDESLLLFARFPLEELDVSNCRNLSDQGFERLLPSLSRLRTLNISGCSKITDATMTTLGTKSPQLRSLNCSKCHLITDTGAKDLFSSILPLQYLNFSNCQLFQGTHFENQNLATLRAIDLVSVKISSESVRRLGISAPNLVRVTITNTSTLRDSGVIALSNSCPYLLHLDLSGCAFVGDLSLDALSQCRPSKLEVLSLICCNSVSDDGIVSLSLGCHQLKTLNLANCLKISDVSLTHLKLLRRLRKLNLYLCKMVSQKAVHRLRRTNPQLNIDN